MKIVLSRSRGKKIIELVPERDHLQAVVRTWSGGKELNRQAVTWDEFVKQLTALGIEVGAIVKKPWTAHVFDR